VTHFIHWQLNVLPNYVLIQSTINFAAFAQYGKLVISNEYHIGPFA